MKIPEDCLFTKEHEWVKIKGGQATVGITDHAQSELGDITFVELPQIDYVCQQFQQFATLESVKAASDVYAPVSGKISAVNNKLQNAPELVNQDAFGKGWFVVIELADQKESANLLSAADYEKYLKETVE
ncbi:MAG: glycine cleavage system protein GcvH [Candidatus Omnitrophota bacterium]|nr:MAG: glycine cleavage system protein GcvH [Candidatus Omnitrophota bacterium]